MKSYATDIRRLLQVSKYFLAGSENPNKVTFVRPITVDNGEFARCQGIFHFHSAERNSEQGRIRLFTEKHLPVEISHCDERALFFALRDYQNELSAQEQQKENEELKAKCQPYFGISLESISKDLGLKDNYFGEDVIMAWSAWLAGEEDPNYKSIYRTIQAIQNIKAAIEKYDGVDPETLPAEDRIKAYWLGKIRGEYGSSEMYAIWKCAKDFGTNIPVWDDIWSSQHKAILDAMREHKITKLYMVSRSTALMEHLHALMNKGWKIVSATMLYRIDWLLEEHGCQALYMEYEEI